ncbi:MAG: hypothetical protein ACR2PK_09995, partial [Acidimicrobiales bacterium]
SLASGSQCPRLERDWFPATALRVHDWGSHMPRSDQLQHPCAEATMGIHPHQALLVEPSKRAQHQIESAVYGISGSYRSASVK